MKKLILPYILLFPFFLSSCFQWAESPDSGSGAKVSAPFGKGKQEIIKLQLEKGPDAILKIDCSKYDNESKKYCEDQKLIVNAQKKEITWQSIFRKGDKYISSFNCKNIRSMVGQKYCQIEQERISKK